jgi:hypothetical protein
VFRAPVENSLSPSAASHFEHVAHRRKRISELVRKCGEKLILAAIASERSAANLRKSSASRFRSVTSWLTVAKQWLVSSIRQRQHLVRHPASLARFEVTKANLDLAVAVFSTSGKNSFMIFAWSSGKKNS